MLHSERNFGYSYWKIIVLTFFLGWVVIWIYRAMLAPVYTEIQQTVGPHSNFDMGLITSFYYVGNTALQIPSGLLVDRFGQKKVLIPGFILFTIGTLCIALAYHIELIYFGALLAGIGSGAYYGASFSMTAQYVPSKKKSFCTAIVNSGSALGMILGMVGSSILVKTLYLPWQTMVFISAGCTILMTFWVMTAIRNPAGNIQKNMHAPKACIAEKDDPPLTLSGKPASKLFSLTMVSCYIMYFTTCYSYYLIVTWMPELLEKERNITGPATGMLTALIAITAVPGSLLFARLSDRFLDRKPQIIIVLEICSFLLVILSMQAPNSTLLSLVLLVYGFLGKMSVDPVLISYISDRCDRRKTATALGVFNFFGISSSIAAPILTGFIMDKTGKGEWGFYFGALLLIVETVIFGIINRRCSTTSEAK